MVGVRLEADDEQRPRAIAEIHGAEETERLSRRLGGGIAVLGLGSGEASDVDESGKAIELGGLDTVGHLLCAITVQGTARTLLNTPCTYLKRSYRLQVSLGQMPRVVAVQNGVHCLTDKIEQLE
jgi:hypothetical protein